LIALLAISDKGSVGISLAVSDIGDIGLVGIFSKVFFKVFFKNGRINFDLELSVSQLQAEYPKCLVPS
jgi:hypothetical protein